MAVRTLPPLKDVPLTTDLGGQETCPVTSDRTAPRARPSRRMVDVVAPAAFNETS